MKRIIYTILGLVFFCSCSEDEEVYLPDYNVSLKVAAENDVRSEVSRAAGSYMAPLPEKLDIVFINNGAGPDGKLSVIRSSADKYETSAKIIAGNYYVEASNYKTEEEALLANGGKGAARYYGKSINYDILNGGVTNIAMETSVSNALLRIAPAGFGSLYQLKSIQVQSRQEGKVLRTVECTSFNGVSSLEGVAEDVWFMAGQHIFLMVYFTFNGEEYLKEVDLGITTAARTCYDIKVNAAAKGHVEIQDVTDNSLEENSDTVVTDPTGGTPV